MMKKIFLVSTLVVLQSCAQMNHSERGLSNVQKKFLSAKESCLIDFNQMKNDGVGLLSLEDHQIIAKKLESCGERSTDELLSEQDRFTHFEVYEDSVWLKTLYGRVYLLKKNVLTVISVQFPVASFDIDKSSIHFYNANGEGRFCTFQILDNSPVSERNSACLKAEKTIDLKDF